jgi:hypothetical protein
MLVIIKNTNSHHSITIFRRTVMYTTNHPTLTKDTSAWIFQVWASFALSLVGVILGIIYLPVEGWVRGFMGLGVLFLTTSCFSLAKTLRDNHEADKLINRISDAKTEKMLTEFELK